jgi:signal transduction histidine kinase
VNVDPWCKRPAREYWVRVASINLAAAVAAMLLLAWSSEPATVGALGRYFAICCIYSYLIGVPAGVLMPWVGARLADRKLPWRVLAMCAILLALAAVGSLAGTAVRIPLGLGSNESYWREVATALRFCFIITMMFGMSAFFYETMRKRWEEATLALRTRELAEERARKLAAEAQLSSLESRIHPHFLFNTLNSIASLIHDEPALAEDMVGKLAALLRFSLDANQQRLVPLDRELKIVADYLAIEKSRLGGRLRYSIDVAGDLGGVETPPLALQTLVENSVKHVVAPRREGGEIRISARAEGALIVLEVADTGAGVDPSLIPAGHGLDNLEARLAALFGGAARLDFLRDGGRALVRISLPETDHARLPGR